MAVEKNISWFRENSPIFKGLETAIPQVCDLLKQKKGIEHVDFGEGGGMYNLMGRANSEIISLDLILTDPSANFPEYSPKLRKSRYLLGPKDIAIFHLEDQEEKVPVEIRVDAVTRPEMEGQGILHGFASSIPIILETMQVVWKNELFGKRVLVVVEDYAKAGAAGKNHEGLSAFLAKKYGATQVGNEYVLELQKS